MVEENFCRPTFLSSVLCSNDFQTNKKSKELDAENTKLATALLPPHHFKMLHISTIFGSCAAKLVKNKMIYRPVNLLWRPGGKCWRGEKESSDVNMENVCCRDECRRRMVQGEFEVGGGSGGPGSGLPGPGPNIGGGGAGGGQAAGGAGAGKLPASPDSPVSDVNSILAGAHLQVGEAFTRFKKWFKSTHVKLWVILNGINGYPY